MKLLEKISQIWDVQNSVKYPTEVVNKLAILEKDKNILVNIGLPILKKYPQIHFFPYLDLDVMYFENNNYIILGRPTESLFNELIVCLCINDNKIYLIEHELSFIEEINSSIESFIYSLSLFYEFYSISNDIIKQRESQMLLKKQLNLLEDNLIQADTLFQRKKIEFWHERLMSIHQLYASYLYA